MARLLVLLLLLFAAPAFGQTFPVPSDILAAGHWGTDGWDERVPTYASGTTLNVLGNGVAVNGGTPPAAAFEFTDIPTDPTGWANLNVQSENYFCTLIINGGTCHEPKARFTANVTHFLFDDPIRAFGLYGQSHCHMFFGNGSANARSTFQSLRQNATKYSLASGGPLNGTAYWFPCIIKDNAFGDGQAYIVRVNDVTFYYREPTLSEAKKNTYLLLGLRYVAGYNMDDGGAWLQARVAAANAQPGTSPTRYRVCENVSSQTPCAVNHNYICNGIYSQSFANADGSDPFSGLCSSSQNISMQFTSPQCWDGVNFWSPGGYKHVIPAIFDTVANANVCPNGWYRLPQLIFNISLFHEGPADYTKWRLASDCITGTNNTCTMHSTSHKRGTTFHIDWMNGWDRVTLRQWHDNCVGIANDPHECLDSTVGPSRRLIRGETSPTGRVPQVDTQTTYRTTSPSGMWKYPTTTAGPKDIHIHGG